MMDLRMAPLAAADRAEWGVLARGFIRYDFPMPG